MFSSNIRISKNHCVSIYFFRVPIFFIPYQPLESLCVFIVLALVLPTHSPLVQVDPCHTPLPQPLPAQTPGQEGPNPDKESGTGRQPKGGGESNGFVKMLCSCSLGEGGRRRVLLHNGSLQLAGWLVGWLVG